MHGNRFYNLNNRRRSLPRNGSKTNPEYLQIALDRIKIEKLSVKLLLICITG